MASFVTTKQLLNVYDIHSVKDEEGKEIRGTAYEFQDYAYRLASNLNDLENLNIYMKLTKKYPRFMLEQAYESIADSNEVNKGRLFMWKFKQVRKHIQKNKDINNFEYKHVISKMKDLRNDLSQRILKKYNDPENNYILRFLLSCPEIFLPEVKRILIIGLSSTLLPSMFENEDTYIFGIDFAKKLTDENKNFFQSKKRRKFITKDFLSNSYKLHQFDLIILQNYWELIPIESENTYLKEFQRILKPKGRILFNFKADSEDTQTWKEIQANTKENKIFFQKKNNFVRLIENFRKFGFYEKGFESYNSEIAIKFEHQL